MCPAVTDWFFKSKRDSDEEKERALAKHKATTEKTITAAKRLADILATKGVPEDVVSSLIPRKKRRVKSN